jgi:uncharacterized protein YcfL
MKKVLSILMVVSIFSLMACGSAEEGKVAEPTVTVEEEKVDTEVEESMEETTVASEEVVTEGEETTEEHVHAEGEEHAH